MERDPGGSPGPGGGVGGPGVAGDDVGDRVEEFVNAGAQGAGAFAVDDADAEDVVFATLEEVLGEQRADVGGAEGVEVEFVCDGDFDGIGIGKIVVHWIDCVGGV